ncbi:hypothetical protein GTP23_11995 [Pseudoduganella sp. FT93W]|uniref:PEP-CTERM sorting domain-containing protein n=1 Tax=Duganella fentianensis TaxID=2692177 RepID=A0A845I4B0_9BURK|nr:hypothetical protein [Duganella fentianensis]MYN45768.1 hypothetical protein [Duganella fentianensis]
MRKFLLAIASMLFMLSNVSHAVPINSTLLKITSVSFSPKTRSIPTSIFCGGSCGFTSPVPFLLQVGVRATINYPVELQITEADMLIIEKDEFYNDLVGNYIQTTNLPRFNSAKQLATINFGVNVDPTTLNSLCALGCDSNAGYLAELGALEFNAAFQLKFQLTSLLNPNYRLDLMTPVYDAAAPLPLPASTGLMLLGLLTVGIITRRSTSLDAGSPRALA